MARHEMGEQTIIAKEHITEFYNNLSDTNVHDHFYNGVYEKACQIGHIGKPRGIDGLIFFVCEQFRKHNIQMPGKQNNTETNIRNWLSVSAPNDSNQSRDNVYRLCFALEMNATETEEFFLKRYLCRPFNYKNSKECVYYFCLNTGRTFSDAERIFSIVETMNPQNVNKGQDTRNIGIALSEITAEEDFLKEMPKYLYEEVEQRNTITQKIIKFNTECRKIAGIEERGSLLKAIYYDELRHVGNKYLGRQNVLDC